MSKHKDYPVTNYFEYEDSRNPYFQKMRELSASTDSPVPPCLVNEQTEQYKGQWRERFADPKQLVLDIGSYLGDTVIELAQANPDQAFIGIEWKNKYAHRAVEKIQNRQLRNVCILRANIARLAWMFAPGELDRVQVFFPDPWPKSAQSKWRAIHLDFFQVLGWLLVPGKTVLVKTDHHDYADFIKRSFLQSGAFDWLVSRESKRHFQQVPPTAFEKIFQRKNEKPHWFCLQRNEVVVDLPEVVQKFQARPRHGTRNGR